MLDGSPFTITLLMRRSCHEPPMRSGDPPARITLAYVITFRNKISTYVDLRIPCHRYLILLLSKKANDAHKLRLTLVVERHPLWLSGAFDIFKSSLAAVGVDTSQDDAVCPEILSNVFSMAHLVREMQRYLRPPACMHPQRSLHSLHYKSFP